MQCACAILSSVACPSVRHFPHIVSLWPTRLYDTFPTLSLCGLPVCTTLFPHCLSVAYPPVRNFPHIVSLWPARLYDTFPTLSLFGLPACTTLSPHCLSLACPSVRHFPHIDSLWPARLYDTFPTLSLCGLPVCTFSPHCLIKGMIVIEHKMCFNFPYSFCLKHFSVYEELSELDQTHISIGLHVKCPLF